MSTLFLSNSQHQLCTVAMMKNGPVEMAVEMLQSGGGKREKRLVNDDFGAAAVATFDAIGRCAD